MPYQTMLSTDSSTHNHETSQRSPLDPLKDHIFVLLGSQHILGLIILFWLWRSVLVPLRRKRFPHLLHLSILRGSVSLLLVGNLFGSQYMVFGEGSATAYLLESVELFPVQLVQLRVDIWQKLGIHCVDKNATKPAYT